MGKPIPPELREQYANAVKGKVVEQTAAERAKKLRERQKNPLIIRLAAKLPGPEKVIGMIDRYQTTKELEEMAKLHETVDKATETSTGNG